MRNGSLDEIGAATGEQEQWKKKELLANNKLT